MEEQKENNNVEQIVYSIPGTIKNYCELGLKQPLVIEIMRKNNENISMLEQSGIETLLREQNVIIQAPTDSKVTNIITISMCQLVNAEVKELQGIMLCHCRELAFRYEHYFKSLVEGIGIKLQLLIGGRMIFEYIKELSQCPQLIVGTPGKVLDMVHRNLIKITSLRYLFFEDMDDIIRVGFSESITELLSYTPKAIKLGFFSQYFSRETQEFVDNLLKAPIKKLILKKVRINFRNQIVGNFLIEVKDEESRKKALLEQLHQYDSPVVIFCNSTTTVLLHKYARLPYRQLFYQKSLNIGGSTLISSEELSSSLETYGFPCTALHDHLSSENRKALLSILPATKKIVCTDSFFSIPQIQQSKSIINYSIPFIGVDVYNRFYHNSAIEYKIVNILTNSEKSWLNYFCDSSNIPLSKSTSKFL